VSERRKMLNQWSKGRESKSILYLDGFRRWLNAAFIVAILCLCTNLAHGRANVSEGLLATVSVAELPKQGQRVYALIASGGPFDYDKDGVVFGNRERQLPEYKRGYYREYTVKTSGSRNRGAKRIVCGGFLVQSPEACYYTDDHYVSFRKIVR
jgi:ribonuclease T1